MSIQLSEADRDRCLAALGENVILRMALADARKALADCSTQHGAMLPPEIRDQVDPFLVELCALRGYSAVLTSASRVWAQQDPDHARTVGPPQGTIDGIVARIDDLLETPDRRYKNARNAQEYSLMHLAIGDGSTACHRWSPNEGRTTIALNVNCPGCLAARKEA